MENKNTIETIGGLKPMVCAGQYMDEAGNLYAIAEDGLGGVKLIKLNTRK